VPGFVGTSRQTKRAFRQTPIRKGRGFRKVPGLMGTFRHVTTDLLANPGAQNSRPIRLKTSGPILTARCEKRARGKAGTTW